MPTLKDIAVACGVSTITVSDVLNGKPGAAGKQTRERILSAARAMNYRPNAVARSLRRRRTHIIGFYGGYGYFPARSLFAGEIAVGLQDGCEENKRDLLTHGTFRGRSVEDIHMELISGQIDGLVLFAPPDDPLASLLAGSSLPVVAIADAVPGIPSVIVDDAHSGVLVARHLAERGHRRTLYYMSSRMHTAVARRLDAFRAEAMQAGMSAPVVVPVDWQGGIEGERPDAAPFGLETYLSGAKGTLPTAAVCWNDEVARKLLAECERRGVRVPQDMAIVGYDGIPPQVLPARVVTSVRLPWAHVAQTAVSLVVTLIGGGDVPPETVLPVGFSPGDTT